MNKGLKGLEERVLSQGLCVSCGACLSLCPYLRSWQGRVVKLHDCGLDEGRCFAYCPKTEEDIERINRNEVNLKNEKVEMGLLKRILMARARDPIWRKKAQSGGMASSLIDFALRKKVIDAAILTLREADFLPSGRIVRNREEILTCAGSSYVSGPTLQALHKGPWQGEEKIGVVGLPCQTLALTRMRSSSLEKRTPVDKVGLIIGLFCTWALEYERFIAFLKERVGESHILKLEITPPPERVLKVHTNGLLHTLPVDEIRPFIRKGCQVCPDMTAELSDISAGTVEGIDGWNTVIIRSDRGERLFEEAEAEGVIECQSLPEDHLNHLKEASQLKKKRASNNMRERTQIGGMSR
jgi:coenzyme F420 hydrogenase subunit beta